MCGLAPYLGAWLSWNVQDGAHSGMVVGAGWEPGCSRQPERLGSFPQNLSKWLGLLTAWRPSSKSSSKQTSPSVQVALPVSACVMLVVGPTAKINLVVKPRVHVGGD